MAYWPALDVELDALLDDSVVAVTVPSAATEVEVASVVVAVVEASAEVLVDVVAVVALASAAGVSWATEISGATPRAATNAAAAMMRTEDFMCIAFSGWGGITRADGELYNIIQNKKADALRELSLAFDEGENSVRMRRKFVFGEVYL